MLLSRSCVAGAERLSQKESPLWPSPVARPEGIPEALPYAILQRLSSTSRAAALAPLQRQFLFPINLTVLV
jgi:hypothetical protein